MSKKTQKMLITVRNSLLNPRLLLCVGLSWIITNGWAYIFIFLGIKLHIGWMAKIAGIYIGILYSPLCVEGILTIAISIFLLKKLFPNDKYTLKLLNVYSRKLKLEFKRKLQKYKIKKHKNNKSHSE